MDDEAKSIPLHQAPAEVRAYLDKLAKVVGHTEPMQIGEIQPELPDNQQPVQVPGFRNPNDPRIPAALRQAALARAQKRRRL